MRLSRHTACHIRLIAFGLLLLTLTLTIGCRPDIVVRLATRVFHDGSLERTVRVIGRTSKGETPTESEWLANDAGLRLADPDAWGEVETGPGTLTASGFFRRAEDLPTLFTLETEDRERPGRTRTLVQIEERVVIQRWIYSERHGDPYSESDSAAALDALVELAVEALRFELKTHFGEDFPSGPAEELFRGEMRGLAAALLRVNRTVPGHDQAAARVKLWQDVLRQRNAPAVDVEDADDFWELEMPALFEWGRNRATESLSTNGQTIRPDELSFWPVGEDFQEQVTKTVERVWGDQDELYQRVEPHVAAIAGYYGRNTIPRFRFEIRAQLPGTLLGTNGTPDGDSVAWLLRERDLTFGEIELRAESAELIDESLKSLGARRSLPPAALLRLADLLWKRDTQGVLAELLATAVDQGSLALLRDENEVPEEWLQASRELADLLDPAVEPLSAGDLR